MEKAQQEYMEKYKEVLYKYLFNYLDCFDNKTIIVDYDAGNLKSVANMLSFLNVPFEITSDKDKILNAKRIIFPGQGHFAQAMGNLEK